ncbi:MAG: MoaD/ThiS family protein [Desulfurococcales archaeon]|nr:MoaD/ThiS family protein [Desulfurococcales archaeon]MEB3779334.1 MoaD/ThiS family protein [Desulfurococcales archaeon]
MTGKGTIIVRYFGILADLAGDREIEVEVEGEVKIRDIIRLPADISIEDLVILVNGASAKPDDTVKPGDRVAVMPHISGGLDTPVLFQPPLRAA